MPKLRPIAADALCPPSGPSAHLRGRTVLLLAGPAALLLQLTEPQIAAATAATSSADHHPYQRLLATVTALDVLRFGSATDRDELLSALRTTHHELSGTHRGVTFRASDPAASSWVLCTLAWSALTAERRYLQQLTDTGQERYLQETWKVGAALGLDPHQLPGSLRELDQLIRRQSAEHVTAMDGPGGDNAREVASSVLRPAAGQDRSVTGRIAHLPIWTASALTRHIATELLPAHVSQAYGLPDRGHNTNTRPELMTGQLLVALSQLPRLHAGSRFARLLGTRAADHNDPDRTPASATADPSKPPAAPDNLPLDLP